MNNPFKTRIRKPARLVGFLIGVPIHFVIFLVDLEPHPSFGDRLAVGVTQHTLDGEDLSHKGAKTQSDPRF